MRKYNHPLYFYALIMLGLSACSAIHITYYDATTYTQLTSLKAEITTLVESFDEKPYSENKSKIEIATLNFKKAYEYEKGKGDQNSDITKQLDKIYSLYKDDVSDYKEKGPGKLGEKYFREAAVILGQAFDIAIATENSKNKGKR